MNLSVKRTRLPLVQTGKLCFLIWEQKQMKSFFRSSSFPFMDQTMMLLLHYLFWIRMETTFVNFFTSCWIFGTNDGVNNGVTSVTEIHLNTVNSVRISSSQMRLWDVGGWDWALPHRSQLTWEWRRSWRSLGDVTPDPEDAFKSNLSSVVKRETFLWWVWGEGAESGPQQEAQRQTLILCWILHSSKSLYKLSTDTKMPKKGGGGQPNQKTRTFLHRKPAKGSENPLCICLNLEGDELLVCWRQAIVLLLAAPQTESETETFRQIRLSRKLKARC